MTPVGFIEGFYGEPWGDPARRAAIDFMAGAGFAFYTYAPKGDPFLRKRWREPVPAEREAELAALAAHCRARGVTFGVGLSPYEIYRAFDAGERAHLDARVALADRIGVEHLAILFDDMRGDLPRVAEIQCEVIDHVRQRTRAREVAVCPTYYSLDPVLDRVFGPRPDGYLEELGRRLDPSIQVFWTGEQICSPGYPVEHLSWVAGRLGRRPLLWDNYPVNDGQRMCKFLHLRAVTGRPPAIAPRLSGHAINPMNQPVLSRIPALTLLASYAGAAYQPDAAWRAAAIAVLGEALAARLAADLTAFHDEGLDRIGEDRRRELGAIYAGFDHPAAREVQDWLAGRYDVTRELVLTQ